MSPSGPELDVARWEMQRKGEPPPIVGEAVLRNYPLRLWVREQEHLNDVVRELQLLLGGHEAGVAPSSPHQLLDVARMFTTLFGELIFDVHEARQRALDAGLDRMDSHVPLVHRAPDYLDHFSAVVLAVDEYCARGELLTPPRPPDLVALTEWTASELTAQYYGAPPTPWAGPF